MLNEKLIIEEVIRLLAILSETVRLKSSINFQDDKTASENFFKGLFNIIYNLKLQNVNTLQVNYPAIDLADGTSGICYQITYENNTGKINETKQKYQKHQLASEFPSLTIFIFGDKPKTRPNDAQVKYKADLIKDIDRLDLNGKKAVLEYLKSQLNTSRQEKQALEMKSIQAVIQYLSKQPCPNTGNDAFIDKPYPEEKLKLRFGDYRNSIKEQFVEHYPSCNHVLEQAKADFIDDGNSGKIKLYLRQKSRDILLDSNNDARTAINVLIEEIRQNIDELVHETAIRYYILSELMDCDIFPLSREEEQSLGWT